MIDYLMANGFTSQECLYLSEWLGEQNPETQGAFDALAASRSLEGSVKLAEGAAKELFGDGTKYRDAKGAQKLLEDLNGEYGPVGTLVILTLARTDADAAAKLLASGHRDPTRLLIATLKAHSGVATLKPRTARSR